MLVYVGVRRVCYCSKDVSASGKAVIVGAGVQMARRYDDDLDDDDDDEAIC